MPGLDFTVRGETFLACMPPRYAVDRALRALSRARPGSGQIAALDRIVRLFLVPEDHERWNKLVTREENPVTMRQLNAIVERLVTEVAGMPAKAAVLERERRRLRLHARRSFGLVRIRSPRATGMPVRRIASPRPRRRRSRLVRSARSPGRGSADPDEPDRVGPAPRLRGDGR